jgi:hypothetical protein
MVAADGEWVELETDAWFDSATTRRRYVQVRATALAAVLRPPARPEPPSPMLRCRRNRRVRGPQTSVSAVIGQS